MGVANSRRDICAGLYTTNAGGKMFSGGADRPARRGRKSTLWLADSCEMKFEIDIVAAQ